MLNTQKETIKTGSLISEHVSRDRFRRDAPVNAISKDGYRNPDYEDIVSSSYKKA